MHATDHAFCSNPKNLVPFRRHPTLAIACIRCASMRTCKFFRLVHHTPEGRTSLQHTHSQWLHIGLRRPWDPIVRQRVLSMEGART